jgi:hypothetical protein
MDEIQKPAAPAAAIEAEPQTPAIPEAPKHEDASSKFALLAKREKAIVRRQQEIKAREEGLSPREQELKQYEELVQQSKKNPLGLLKKLGWDYQMLTDLVLNEEKPTPELEIRSVKQEIEDLRKEREQERQSILQKQAEAQKAEYEEKISAFKDEITDFVKSKADDFEFINQYGQFDLIYETIEAGFHQNGKMMSIEEAARLVESHLESEVEKVTKTKKFQTKFGAKLPETVEKQDKGLPTLSNKLAASQTAPIENRRLSDQERIQRALAKLERKPLE